MQEVQELVRNVESSFRAGRALQSARVVVRRQPSSLLASMAIPCGFSRKASLAVYGGADGAGLIGQVTAATADDAQVVFENQKN